MKLNHINLVVPDVARTTRFFETYFNFKCVDTKGNNIIAVLCGTDNFNLVLMASSPKEENTSYPEAFHIGFILDNTDQVNETYIKLKSAGINIGHEPRTIRDSFGFYFHFDNIMIEVAHYLK